MPSGGGTFCRFDAFVELNCLGAGEHMADKVTAFDEFHREEPAIVDREELVEIDQVLMTDVAERAKFLLEADESLGIDLSHRLESEQLAALLIVGFINDTHTSRAQSSNEGTT